MGGLYLPRSKTIETLSECASGGNAYAGVQRCFDNHDDNHNSTSLSHGTGHGVLINYTMAAVTSSLTTHHSQVLLIKKLLSSS